MIRRADRLLLPALCLTLLFACSPKASEDVLLQQRVTAAIAAASDLPREGFSVSVNEGVVRVSGSLLCDDCGGLRTPGGEGSIQQSMGAVIRAVPGVAEVTFDLQ